MSCALADPDRPASARPKSILVMDDDSAMGDLIRAILSPLGYSVVCTYDGGDALQQYTDALHDGHPFDMVLMDLHVVYGMNGTESLRHLRALHPQAKVVAISGEQSQGVLAEVQRCGFDRFLAKPYSIVALRQMVEELLGTA